MTAAFTIDPANGDIRVAGTVALTPGHARSELGPAIAGRLVAARDLGNGRERLDLDGLTFGGCPSSLALCFGAGRLEQVSWSVRLPDASPEGWPTGTAIEAEVAFVRSTLSRGMGLHPGATSWGEIWSEFDRKAFMAAHGLRYRRA